MDALILCGGAGTRCRELTQDRIPKIMIPYKGRPLVDHIIDTLLTLKNIGRIFLCAGFKSDILHKYIQKKYYPRFFANPGIEVITESQPLGTGGALLNLCDSEPYLSEYIMVVNGDCLIAPTSLKEFIKEDVDGRIYCTKVEDSRGYGLIKVGALSRIINFDEKQEGGGLINCGWYIFRSDLIKDIVVKNCSLECDLIPAWLEQHKWLEAAEIDSKEFIDLGTTAKINKENK